MLRVVTGSKHSAQNGFTPTDPILRQPNTWRKHDFTPTAPSLRRPNTRRKHDFTPTDPILRQPNTRRKHHFTPTDPVLRRLTTRSKPLFLRRVFAPSDHSEHYYYTPDGFLTLLIMAAF